MSGTLAEADIIKGHIMANGLKDIITQLERQKIAIDRAIAALREIGDGSLAGLPVKARKGKSAIKKKRLVSSEARERMAAAQRARWAATRKATKKTAKAFKKAT